MSEPYWEERGLSVTVLGGSAPRNIVLKKPYALIGSDASVCDVVVDDHHQPDRCFVVCLTLAGLKGVSLAYRRSPRRFQRVDGQRGLRIGDQRFIFHVDSNGINEPAEPEDYVYPAVRWGNGTSEKRNVRLRPETPLLFGRNLPSPMRLKDTAVSTVHGFVYRHGQQLWVVDLGSRNGVHISQRAVRCAPLEIGQSFVAGQTTVEYTLAKDSAKTRELAEQKARVDEATSALADQETEIERQRQEFEAYVRETESELREQRELLERQQLESDAQRRECADAQTELIRQRDTLQQIGQALETQHSELHRDRRFLQAERDRFETEHRKKVAQIETADERLLVRRIRMQRERTQWEDALRSREATLQQRELQLQERGKELQQLESAIDDRRRELEKRERWRTIVRPSNVDVSNHPRSSIAAKPDSELVNPVLESAEFHDLLHGLEDLQVDDAKANNALSDGS